MNKKYLGLFKAFILCFFSLAFLSEIAGIGIPFKQSDSEKSSYNNQHIQEKTVQFNLLEFVETFEIEEDTDEDHLETTSSFIPTSSVLNTVSFPLLEDEIISKRFLSLFVLSNHSNIPLYKLFCSWKSFLS